VLTCEALKGARDLLKRACKLVPALEVGCGEAYFGSWKIGWFEEGSGDVLYEGESD